MTWVIRILSLACTIKELEEVLVAFETFNHITLEILRVAKLEKDVLVIQEPGKEDPKLPVKYHVSVQESATVLDLKSSLSAMSGIPALRLKICSVDLGLCNIAYVYRYDHFSVLVPVRSSFDQLLYCTITEKTICIFGIH